MNSSRTAPAVGGVPVDSPLNLLTADPGPSSRVSALLRGIRLATWAAYCELGVECVQVNTPDGVERGRAQMRWTRRFLAGTIRRMGLTVRVHGPVPSGGVILAPNHLGYSDIAAVGSCLECSFTTTTEVMENPIAGRLVRGAEAIVVPRRLTSRLAGARALVRQRLERGFPVCIFLEGTSTGGDRVLPFRSFFLEAAVETGAPVVPVALHWRATAPGTRVDEDLAFWKDHQLLAHLWRLLGLRGFEVDVSFGEPISSENTNRKILAEEVRGRVVELLEGSGWRGSA